MRKKYLSIILTLSIPCLLFFLSSQKLFAQTAPLVVYGNLPQGGEALNPDWDSLAFGASTKWELNNPSPVFVGKTSLLYEEKVPHQMLALRTTTPVPINSYNYLNFAMQASQPGRHYLVTLLASSNSSQPNAQIGSPIAISPPAGSWTTYSLSLSDFGVGSQEVYGVGFQENDGSAQPPIYIDEVQFSNTTTIESQTATGVTNPTGATVDTQVPVATDTPTPSGPPVPYSPTISPWIFLLPGLLIFLIILLH